MAWAVHRSVGLWSRNRGKLGGKPSRYHARKNKVEELFMLCTFNSKVTGKVRLEVFTALKMKIVFKGI